MITQVDEIIQPELLFNCTPSLDDYDEVSEGEYENYINNCIRVYTRVIHTNGANIKNRKGEVVAVRTKIPKYYIHK